MSTITSSLILTLFTFCLSYCQNPKNTNSLTILVIEGDQQIKSLSINKDTTSLSVAIYRDSFQVKANRVKALKENQKKLKSGDIDLPQFSVNLISTFKPEQLDNLSNLIYITPKQFAKSNFKTTSPTSLIQKLKNGKYLKWTVFILSPE